MTKAIKVDARGLSCPEPIMLTKQAMRQGGEASIIVLVDSAASRDNVKRAAEMAGRTVGITEMPEGEFQLEIKQ